MSTIILAIDAGAKGAIAASGSAGVEVYAMPKSHEEIIAILTKYSDARRNPFGASFQKPKAYLEDLVKFMGVTPMSHMAVYASNWGLLKGALMAIGFEVILVRPQAWQSRLGLGITGVQRAKTKGMTPVEASAEKSRIRKLNKSLKYDFKSRLYDESRRLFPHLKFNRDMADTLLLLRYGMMENQN